MKPFVPVLLAAASLLACEATPPAHGGPWKGQIDLYGTMRTVMMEGKTEGRIELASLQGDKARVGIGALEGLAGEVVLLDGVAWCTRSGALGTLETRAGAEKGVRATLLATARVSQWMSLSLPEGLAFADLEQHVGRVARENGLSRTVTFPFLIEGAFAEVRAHVLHGRCPEMGAGPPETEPVRRMIPVAHGRLLGFYTGLEPGMLTHKGEKIHVHLLVKEGESIAAHVDDLRISAGAVLKLPLVE